MPSSWRDSLSNASSHVKDYGWSAGVVGSSSYLAPEVLRLLAASRARRVLDLGCGNGSLTAALARSNLGLDMVGCDADANGIAIARAAAPEVRFEVCDLAQDPSADLGRFDAVVSTEVIEHLYLPAQLLQFAAHVLKPGGKLILSTPYHGYVKNLALALLDKWDDHHTALWDGGHIKFWSRRTLAQLLTQNGFRDCGFVGAGRVPFLWKSMIVVAELA